MCHYSAGRVPSDKILRSVIITGTMLGSVYASFTGQAYTMATSSFGMLLYPRKMAGCVLSTWTMQMENINVQIVRARAVPN